MINGTQTADGFIPYLNKYGLDLPVALLIPENAPVSLLQMLQMPQRTSDGDLVFVVPGGGRVTA